MRESVARTPAPNAAGHSVIPQRAGGMGRAELVDRRPQSVVQRQLAQFVQDSPRVAAQARRMAALFGSPVVQRQVASTAVLQAMAGAGDSGVGWDRSTESLGSQSRPAEDRAPREAAPASAESQQPTAGTTGCGCVGGASKGGAKGAPAQLKAAPVQFTMGDEVKTSEGGRKANRTGMPDGLKRGVESLSGQDLSDVKVHTNSDKPAQLNALAYAQGNNIHLGPGQERHLPHEAWHLAQQKQGRVQPTTQLKGQIPINDDQGLEHEADVMGAKAARMHRK